MINSTKKINIALVGCGRISKNHIRAIAYHNKKINFIAICDSSKNRIEAAIKNFDLFKKEFKIVNENKIKHYFDFNLLISDIKEKKICLDLIVLATPSGLHAEQTKLSANVGINVCTEKPMATNWKDGLDMNKVCKKKGVKLFVVKQNRYNKTLLLLKKQLLKNRFGKLSIININVFWQRPQNYYDQDNWRGTIKFDGGALMNQASHYVDLLHWLVGPVESISASTATLGRDIEVEDSAALQIRFKNGAIGTMAVTMLTYPKNLEGSITILGEKGTVKIGGVAVNKIEHWDFKDKNEQDESDVYDANYETDNVYGNGHIPYYENMIKSLNNEEEAICDGHEGLKTLELICAAYKSSSTNKVIKLPL